MSIDKIKNESSLSQDIQSNSFNHVAELKRLAAIVNFSSDAIISKDLNGVITSWNPGAENIFGYSANEAIGSSMLILFPLDHLNEEALILNKIIAGEKIVNFETIRKRKDGKIIEISTTISPINDEMDKIIGISSISRDISHQKSLERTLQAQKLASQALSIRMEQREKYANELLAINLKLKNSVFETVELARQLAEMRDLYTSGHERNVGDLSEAIAGELGLEQEFKDGIRVAGYLHDIGKMVIPVEILVKPTRLNAKEIALVQDHVIASYQVLKDISFPWTVAKSVLQHHERLDGSGYPSGLKGDGISLGGRILAVADVYDAMVNRRPYRPALGMDLAIEELIRGSGSIYDKAVVDACISQVTVKGFKLKTEFAPPISLTI